MATKVTIIPRYINTIIVYASDKEAVKALANTKHKFDENGECELVMEFYDGIAYAIDGSGLIMTYPLAEKVQKFTILQNTIIAYTGIDDGTINQHDIALKYGHLAYSDKKGDHITSFCGNQLYRLGETFILMGADLMEKVLKIVEDYQEAEQLIHEAAMEFEENLDWQEDDERDYYLTLGEFEDEFIAKLEKEYDYTPDEDEEDPEDEPEEDPEDEQDFINKCNEFTELATKYAQDATKYTADAEKYKLDAQKFVEAAKKFVEGVAQL